MKDETHTVRRILIHTIAFDIYYVLAPNSMFCVLIDLIKYALLIPRDISNIIWWEILIKVVIKMSEMQKVREERRNQEIIFSEV